MLDSYTPVGLDYSERGKLTATPDYDPDSAVLRGEAGIVEQHPLARGKTINELLEEDDS